ncbi:MAG TPA: 50S ribosomal protein L10 [Gemmataceae bacterium]|jgi:large subunit ribosomal protein L10|nr:50S ribosomal protein L10 [Gemmataceae bacterium]
MSKAIKQMQMDTLSGKLKEVRDMVFLNVIGLDGTTENKLRLDLRKKGVTLHQVKNTLARRVLGQLGITMAQPWTGPTTIAWGLGSISELSKEMETIVKKNDKKVTVKGVIADGSEMTFAQALKMPTKAEALGRVVMLALSPAARISGGLKGPAGIVSGQIKSISEKKEEAPAAADAPAPTPPA